MKSILVLDQHADVKKATSVHRKLIRYVPVKGEKRPLAIFPKGTEFEGDQALFLVRTGQAKPSDDECAKACGMSPDEIDVQQTEYKMDTLGIHDEGDRDLYRGGIILGYKDDESYIPGPNWADYKAAQDAIEKDDEI